MALHLQAPPTDTQAIGLEVSRIIASLLSLFGATYIIQHIIRNSSKQGGILLCQLSSFKKLILMMSVMDWIYAVTSSCSSTIAPKDDVDWLIHFARGTWGTCEAFAFIGTGSSLASIGYNGSLTLHYLLTIRYGWTERALYKIRWLLHGIPLLYGWIVAIVALPLDYYNPVATGCSIAAYPFACKSRGNCERGENAFIYRLVLGFGYLWIIFGFSVIAMSLIYTAIVKIDNQQQINNHNQQHAIRSMSQPAIQRSIQSSSVRSIQSPSSLQPMTSSTVVTNNIMELRKDGLSTMRFRNGEAITVQEESLSSTSSSPTRLHRLRKQFAIQALLYCTAFFFTYIFSSVAVILVQWTNKPIYIPIVFLSNILESLQGFWNAFIYIRPRIVRWWYRRRKQQQQQQLLLLQRQQQQTPQEQQQQHCEDVVVPPPSKQQQNESLSSSSSHEQQGDETK